MFIILLWNVLYYYNTQVRGWRCSKLTVKVYVPMPLNNPNMWNAFNHSIYLPARPPQFRGKIFLPALKFVIYIDYTHLPLAYTNQIDSPPPLA